MSFGKRATANAATAAIAVDTEAPFFGRFIRWALAACLAAGVLYVAYATFGPKPFPSEGTVFEQCAYAVRAMRTPVMASGCTLNTYAADIVRSYHLWEKYGYLDPDFPWSGDGKTRCISAISKGSKITFEKIGVPMADADLCSFEEDQDSLIESYFTLIGGQAKH